MKRFYLMYLEGLQSVSVHLRTNHEMIYTSLYLDRPDDVRVLKKLYKMTMEEFLSLVREKCGDRPLRQYNDLVAVFNRDHAEEWYNGAWSYSTAKVEKMLKLGEAPEMDEEDFFLYWKETVDKEKKMVAEKKRLEQEAKKLSENKLVKKTPLKRKVEEKAESLNVDDINAMVDELYSALNVNEKKSRLVHKPKKALNRKQK